MWYIVSFLVGAALCWVWFTFFASKEVAPQVPPPAQDALKIAVQQLHKVLFMGAGTVVTPAFNAVWRAAGLEEKGVPAIDGKGRT